MRLRCACATTTAACGARQMPRPTVPTAVTAPDTAAVDDRNIILANRSLRVSASKAGGPRGAYPHSSLARALLTMYAPDRMLLSCFLPFDPPVLRTEKCRERGWRARSISRRVRNESRILEVELAPQRLRCIYPLSALLLYLFCSVRAAVVM